MKFLEKSKMTVSLNSIHKIIWEIDPLNTDCKNNREMKKQYWGEACGIYYLLHKGHDAHYAVHNIFEEFFCTGIFESEKGRDLINKIAVDIKFGRVPLTPEKIQLLKEVDSKFLRIIFRDKFIFHSTLKEYLEIHDSELSIGQKKIAKIIKSTCYYPERKFDKFDNNHDIIFQVMDDLDGVFVWNTNSEGPFIFCGHIISFLIYFNKDIDWFKSIWNDEVQAIEYK